MVSLKPQSRKEKSFAAFLSGFAPLSEKNYFLPAADA
jgi:hypothetical protein